MKLIAALVLLAGTLSIAIPLGNRNAEVRCLHGYAFPDLQNTWDKAKAQKILDTWKEGAPKQAMFETMHTDRVFAVFYAPLLALLAWQASLRRPTPWVARAGRWLAIAALIGGLADVGENTVMLHMVDKNSAAALPLMIAFTILKLIGGGGSALYVLFAHFDS